MLDLQINVLQVCTRYHMQLQLCGNVPILHSPQDNIAQCCVYSGRLQI